MFKKLQWLLQLRGARGFGRVNRRNDRLGADSCDYMFHQRQEAARPGPAGAENAPHVQQKQLRRAFDRISQRPSQKRRMLLVLKGTNVEMSVWCELRFLLPAVISCRSLPEPPLQEGQSV